MTGKHIEPTARDDSTTQQRGADDRAGYGPLAVVNDMAAMVKWLESERDRSLRDPKSCCVIVCRPDPQDTLPMDQAVQSIGELFITNLRPYDSVHRYGAERFILTLRKIAVSDATAVMARLRIFLAQRPVLNPDGKNVFLTASFGGAMMNERLSIVDTISQAEKSFETAVQGGGNRVCMWAPEVS